MTTQAMSKRKHCNTWRRIIAVAVFLLIALTAFYFSLPFFSSALGTIAAAVLADLIISKIQGNPWNKCTCISFAVCSFVVIACTYYGANAQLASVDVHYKNSSLPSGKDVVVPQNTDSTSDTIVYPTKSENNHEIRTAVSFLTPEQAGTESEDSTMFSPGLSDEEIRILFPQREIFRSKTDGLNEYTLKLDGFLQEYIQGFLHTIPNCEDRLLNGSAELGRCVTAANEIDMDIKTGRSVALYEQLMEIYEKAYALDLKSSVISLQLARPYAEIIEIYPRDTPEDCDQIFHYGIQGIRYYIETLAYESVRGAGTGDLLYRIGQVYHYIADVPNLDRPIRTELYQMAGAYLDLAGTYEMSIYSGYSKFYAGMVKHKLGVISGADNAFYLLEAANCYQQAAQEQKMGRILLGDAYKYESDVYLRMADYVQNYGKTPEFQSAEDYRALASDRAAQSRLLYQTA